MEIHGHEQVLAMLNELSKEDGKPIARAGLRAGAKVVLPVVKQLAAKHRVSGTMMANLKIRGGGGGKGAVRVKIGASKKDWTGKAFYTLPVLFGHRIGKRPTTRAGRRELKKNDTRQFVPGDDFIEQAFQQTQQPAMQATIDTMEAKIAQIAAK